MCRSKLHLCIIISIIFLQMGLDPSAANASNDQSSKSPYENAPDQIRHRLKAPPENTPVSDDSEIHPCLDCFSWDVDGNGKAEPLTDGLIVLRYLFGFTDQALVNGALASNATRGSSEAVTNFIKAHESELDIDDDDQSEPLTDGLLLLRYLFGFEGSALINGAMGSNANRATASEVGDFLFDRLPTTQDDTPSALDPAWDLASASPAQVGTSQSAVDSVIEHIFTDNAVQGALVTKDGYVIGERYSSSYDADSLGTSWSVAKSFYSAAIGVAIGEGLITSVDQKVSEILTEWQGTSKADITLHNMLQMRSGYSSIDEVFFTTDQTAYAIDRPRVHAPGSRFAYSNANSQLFEPILRRVTGISAHDYLSLKILAPIGINTNEVGLWFDATGINPMTYCCIDMKAADFARFGLLYARGGLWRDTQIVPAEYVDNSLIANGWYGYQWWIMNSDYFSGDPVAIEVAAAQGLDGQYIFVWPEEDVVIVVLSQYSHSVEQGYVVDLAGLPLNFPDTCTARNNCPGAIGDAVPSFSHFELVERMARLRGNP